ncbi:MAG: 2-oxo acid dehydrogenase subunit E2 [Methylococcaceae bacterium]|nr:2-oxo acid dehydrogenase subunit E2 [Methylococcaceae bacterium]
MSELIEIKIPDLGGADEVEIVEILIQPGDAVEKEQTLAVMESDKATMDLPASMPGTIQEIIIKVGDKVSQDSLVAMLRPAVSEPATEMTAIKEPKEVEPKIEQIKEVKTEDEAKPAIDEKKKETKPIVAVTSNGNAHATPGVRMFARELGVDLNKIQQGSGRKGRILREDVQAFVKKVMAGGSAQSSGAGISPIPEVDFSQFGETDIQPLSKIKRLTGDHMVRVCLNLPMVTQHDEADITDMEDFRKSNNAAKPEIKLTGLVFIIKALVSALKQFPQFNSSLSADGQSLIFKKYVNIGIAVETPNGLMVPVIRGADAMSLNELSEQLVELSGKARHGKLPPAAMQGGSMSISSLGGIGGTAFTPIVNAPEVAILGVSRSKMQPVWQGNEFVPRLMLPLDLTYDHRVIDGAEAARFLVAITQSLGDIRRLLL